MRYEEEYEHNIDVISDPFMVAIHYAYTFYIHEIITFDKVN